MDEMDRNKFAIVTDEYGDIEEVIGCGCFEEQMKVGNNLLQFINSDSNTKYIDFFNNLKEKGFAFGYGLNFVTENQSREFRINGNRREGKFYITALCKSVEDTAILNEIVHMNNYYMNQLSYLLNFNHILKKDNMLNNKELKLRDEHAYNAKLIKQQYTKLFEYSKTLGNMAIKDPITGINNQIYLNHIIHNELDKFKKNAIFIYIDIDHFQKVNDQLGYEEGNKLLQKFVGIYSLYFKGKKDIIFRLEGDEFLILCLDQNIKTVEKIVALVNRDFKNLTDITELSYGFVQIYPRDLEKGIKVDTILEQAYKKVCKHKKSKEITS